MSSGNPNGIESVLITGGAGYVGSALVPELLERGYCVRVVDLFWYGRGVYGPYAEHGNLELRQIDIRNEKLLRDALVGMDAVIHLACVSNDPSFDLDPALGRSINYDAFDGLLRGAADQSLRRFVYASSSSVYGVKEEPDVREDATPEPLTDYSRYKLACERDMSAMGNMNGMQRVIIRPATVCGYAPRLRLDLTVNILTIHALVNHRIRIFGGKQLRPNINIKDMVRAYSTLLDAPAADVGGQVFNVGYQNRSVEDIALIVRETLGNHEIELAYEPSDDLRSYHINSDRIRDVLGFTPQFTIEDAVSSIAEAFRDGLIDDPMRNPLYSNIKRMREIQPS